MEVSKFCEECMKRHKMEFGQFDKCKQPNDYWRCLDYRDWLRKTDPIKAAEIEINLLFKEA